MRDAPSDELLELLALLLPGLPQQLPRVARRVRKLTGTLPHFDSVWVDALAHAKFLTAYQARQINHGSGSELLLDRFVVQDRLPSLGYADAFLVRDAQNAERRHSVNRRHELLLLAAPLSDKINSDTLGRLANVVENSNLLETTTMVVLRETGKSDTHLWATADFNRGIGVSEWLAENGRFPPMTVLQIARQMLVPLCELERRGTAHGDLRARNISLQRDGTVVLLLPGLRAAIHPQEGLSLASLPPECYEALAPERILRGKPPTVKSDLFSCACVWRQLLTGRPAIAGANSLAKIKAAAGERIADVRQIAPDTPPVLAEVIAACTEMDPINRPRSFAEIARILGPPSKQGAVRISHCLKKPERWLLPRTRLKRSKSRLRQHILEASTAIVCILAALGSWRLMVRPTFKTTPSLATITKPVFDRPEVRPVATTADPEVKPASYKQNATRPQKPSDRRDIEPLQLPTDRVLRLATLTPRAEQLVCGTPGHRPTIVVPSDGLVIEQPHVRFKDIDFVAEDDYSPTAMIELRAATISFDGCTFRGRHIDTGKRSAIHWTSEAGSSGEDWSAETDRLSLVNCVFQSVDVAVDRTRVGEAAIEIVNSLLVASGPLIRISSPTSNSPVALTLDHCTLRESGPAFQQHELRSSQKPGRVTVAAIDCVFAPRDGRALLEIDSAQNADNANRIIWTGQGSLIEQGALLIGSNSGDNVAEPLDDAILQVSGLSRSQLEFEGQQLDRPSTSELRRWAAPRRDSEAPGISSKELPAETNRLTSAESNLRLN